MNEDIKNSQIYVCEKYGTSFYPSDLDLKIGISKNIKDGAIPINGLRHPPEGDTTGWYIWGGEEFLDDDPDFFVPLHVKHLEEWCPEVLKFLGLPPGWRFLIANDYEDVWYDDSLLILLP